MKILELHSDQILTILWIVAWWEGRFGSGERVIYYGPGHEMCLYGSHFQHLFDSNISQPMLSTHHDFSLDTVFVFAREYIERQHSLPSRNIQRSPAWHEAKKPVSRLCPGVFPVNDTSKAFRQANGKKNAYVHELMRIYNYLSRDENDSSHTTTLLSSPSLHTAMFFFF